MDMTRSSTVCLTSLHHSFSVLPFSRLSHISNLVRRTCPLLHPERSEYLLSVDFLLLRHVFPPRFVHGRFTQFVAISLRRSQENGSNRLGPTSYR